MTDLLEQDITNLKGLIDKDQLNRVFAFIEDVRLLSHLEELRERRKVRPIKKIMSLLKWHKGRVGNNPLIHREQRAIIRVLEWVLSPEKEQ